MKHFFVIGDKASKSLSPLIFNHWFKKYKIQAKYTYVEVSPKNFFEILNKKTKDRNLCGFNVTIPFKKNILKIVEAQNSHAKKIGAVNCVTINKKIKGINTDWIGYLNSIKEENITKSKNILLLGYGGASQAIYYGFSLKGYKNINVFNRSKKTIKKSGAIKYTRKYSLINSYLADADLIINTTPINPLNKNQINLIKEHTIVSDIVYKPKETAFLRKFKKNKKIYGISMLIEQALPCFNHWFGFTPKVDESLLKKINRKIK